jgi:SAM-dependent methyltransferase
VSKRSRTDAEIVAELFELADRHGAPSQFRSRLGAHQYVRLYRLVRRHVRSGAEVLDWGAGNGHFSFFLSRAGYRATGYSFEPPTFLDRLDDASYEFVAGIPGDPVTIPFDEASFDAVVSVGVLEHVRETGGDETESMREIARLLRPGGAFVCYHFPNRYSLVDFAARRLPVAHHHVHRYTRRDIEELARRAGHELLEVRRYAILPRNPGSSLPRRARRSAALARAWDAADNLIGAALSPLCTNYFFVTRKPLTTGDRRPAG